MSEGPRRKRSSTVPDRPTLLPGDVALGTKGGAPAPDDDEDMELEDASDEHGPLPIPMLHVAVYEGAEYLAGAEEAIVRAGHAAVIATTGKDGVASLMQALSTGYLDAVIVGVPGGEAVIDAAHAVTPRRPVIIAACSGRGSDAAAQANEAGADLVAIRPHDPERLAPVLLGAARLLEDRRNLRRRRNTGRELGRIEVSDADVRGLQPFEAFQRVLEIELKSARRHHHPLAVGLFALDVPQPTPPKAVMKDLKARVGEALIRSIRDVDLATELDGDKFLMLLPYTDLNVATDVARRIINSVGQSPEIAVGGRTIRPRLFGAVAGAKAGQQPSFARLMRDAARALDEARKGGSELAVSPPRDPGNPGNPENS
jgi:GGDEF domain-containing protein